VNPILTRPTRAEIDLSALRHNLEAAKALASPAGVMAVVKAEAYGHGLIRIAQEFEQAGVEYLGVSFMEEGAILREAGVSCPILVMGGLVDEQIDRYLDHNLTITVSSVWKARQTEEAASKSGRRARVHLKFDTGIGRIGQSWLTAGRLLEETSRLPHLDIEGVYTHLASSDAADQSFAMIQIQRFEQVMDIAARLGLKFKHIHCANSGALLQFADRARFTLTRPGIMLYGYPPSERLLSAADLRPVMALKTRIVYVKKPPAGTPIGYDSTWRTPGDRWIATLPVGYGDGFPRRAGNRAYVLLRGKPCLIVGRVSMDQITIDAGDEAWLGEEVVLFGETVEGAMPIWELCRSIDATPYEVLCSLTARVPRIYL